MIYSVSEIGDMMDFLKAFPFVSMEDYIWNLSVPKIRIMSSDHTHVNYLTKNQAQMKKNYSQEVDDQMLNDLGIPIVTA